MKLLIRPVLLAALSLGACGGGDGNDSGSSTTPPPSGGTTDGDGTQETTIVVNCGNVTANATVNIANEAFDPGEVELPVNGVMRWINLDDETHTVTSGEPGHSDAGALFDSGNLAPGASFCLQLSNDGEFDYFCSIHPEMQGEIEVGTARNDDDDDAPDNPSGDDGSDEGNDANRGRG